MSTKRTATKRRDQDPVRVHPDGRVVYWTGGRPGAGHRKTVRCGGDLVVAEAKARDLRLTLARTMGRGAHPEASLDQLMQDLLVHLRDTHAPEGSVRQYKSNWNTWITDQVGATRCLDVDVTHWASIFAHLNKSKASEQTVRSMSRTLGVLMEFGVEHGYFVVAEPFAEPRVRRNVVKKASRKAAIHRAEADERIPLDLCPTLSDVERYADALEAEYPGYGRRLVLLGFATGLRLNELLALRDTSIDLNTGRIDVLQQLDRYNRWPAEALPKGGKTREAMIWDVYIDVARSLVTDAQAREGADHGWLFPRWRSNTAWSDQASKLATAAKKACNWDWTFHWLRHAWASISLAPEEFGGYGLDPASVQKWLGHAKLSTTLDMYVVRQPGDLATAKARTGRLPGTASGQR